MAQCRFVEPNGECAIHSKTTDPMEERAYAALCSVGQAELEAQLAMHLTGEAEWRVAHANTLRKLDKCESRLREVEIQEEELGNLLCSAVPDCTNSLLAARTILAERERERNLARITLSNAREYLKRERAWIRELEDLLQQIKQAITLQRSGAALNRAKKNA